MLITYIKSFSKCQKLLIGLITMLSIQGCEKTIPHRISLQEAYMSYSQGDHIRAFRLTEALAYDGNAKAQYALGYLYYHGTGAPQDRSLGISWMQQAAENGNDKAKVALKQLARADLHTPPNADLLAATQYPDDFPESESEYADIEFE